MDTHADHTYSRPFSWLFAPHTHTSCSGQHTYNQSREHITLLVHMQQRSTKSTNPCQTPPYKPTRPHCASSQVVFAHAMKQIGLQAR